MKSGGFHFQRLEASLRSAPTLSMIHWMNTEATSMASKSVIKSVIENSGFQKSLQINGEVNPEFTFVD
jgi:hypothetical protein